MKCLSFILYMLYISERVSHRQLSSADNGDEHNRFTIKQSSTVDM